VSNQLLCKYLFIVVNKLFNSFQYENDVRSDANAWHITGTEDQSESHLWKNLRRCRITASRFKKFASSPQLIARDLWEEEEDLSFVRSLSWGIENEPLARMAYTQSTGRAVQEVGLFISKKNPLFGASPDGVVENGKGLLEVKCPFSLKETNLAELTKNGHFYTCSDGPLKLRLTHAYYYQVQLQMFVTGATYTDFFV
jgi:hypothetical protein